MKKRLIAIGTVSALCIAMTATACGTQTAATTEAETTMSLEGTFTGVMTGIEEDSITIETEEYGELTFTITDDTEVTVSAAEGDQSNGGSTSDVPANPDGEGGDAAGQGSATDPGAQAGNGGDQQASDPGAQAGDGETPPEKPDGESGDTADQGNGDGETPPDGLGGSSLGDPPDGQGGGDTAASDPGAQAGGGDQQASDSGAQAGDGETPPEKPDGESGDSAEQGNGGGETPPDKPDGESGDSAAQGNGGNSSADPGAGDMETGDFDEEDLYEMLEDDIEVTITSDAAGNALKIEVTMDMSSLGGGQQGGQGGGQPGGGSSNVEYTAVNTYTEDTEITGETFESTGTDENAILVDEGATVTLKDVTVKRNSSSSSGGDNASFYGVGASILAKDGTAIISGATIDSDASGGAGAFAYGDGVVYISDSTITTKQSSSGGIHAAGGGTLYAENLNVTTSGGSAAAIRSDRGGGTMVVDGGTYTSNGSGSPAIYCTADISVNNSELTANGSEAICIEGFNSIRLFDCNLTGNMQESSQNDCTWNIILYQSMSGDSEVGNSTFEMIGGTLTAKSGGMFYTTNTESTFILSDVTINYSTDSPFLLKCTGNANQRGWGTTGKNGAECTFTAVKQKLDGTVIWDSISTLDMYLTEGSTLTGAFVNDESCAGDGGDGYAALYVSKDSTWVVTGNSTLTDLYTEGTIKDASGNTVTIQGADGTVYVQGTSSYTITVSSYTASVELDGAGVVESFSSYKVDMLK